MVMLILMLKDILNLLEINSQNNNNNIINNNSNNINININNHLSHT